MMEALSFGNWEVVAFCVVLVRPHLEAEETAPPSIASDLRCFHLVSAGTVVAFALAMLMGMSAFGI